MSASDAFVVGEGWISEHYFTTDATSQSFRSEVIARRKDWDAQTADAAADGHDVSTPRSRFTAARADLQARLAELSHTVETLAESAAATGTTADTTPLADAADMIADTLITVLGLDRHGLRMGGDGPLRRVHAAGSTGAAQLVVVRALPVTALEELLTKDAVTLRSEVIADDEALPTRSVARLLSTLFVAEEPPALALVLAGRWAMLAERARWAEGRYLAVDIQLIAERNDTKRAGEVDTALTCLAAESIAPDADGALWWTRILEESVKHTVGVSKDLREGVRLSIEILANDVVARRRDLGLEPLPASEAQPLAKQCLRFLYRILFLLYAEASPELGVLPAGAPEYDAGYSLDRLREMVQVPLHGTRAEQGTHLYESLAVLFRLVDSGHMPAPPAPDDPRDEGLVFHPLRADLFAADRTAHLDEVKVSNAALQRVLGHLLLSKEKRGTDRGYISYAELGINQLGAVYEGLMSYTGFFAETDLYEVAKGGDGSKGSWVVPADRIDGIAEDDFIKREDPITGERQPVLHRRGTFVFRLAGRERQQSASYYTPEVLTRFTVGQALEELLDQDGTTTTAAEILDLTVCEPALGSGAFAIEAVRQLASQYLARRQEELGKRIDPDDYPRELQRVKAFLALHNVYGVDLNATAVELAEISLWLDTMVAGLDAPWFGLHLRRGNSLIGAKRAVFRRDQITDKSWLTAVPRDAPLTSLADDVAAGRLGGGVSGSVHHFLLPAVGWGAAADAKEAAALAPEAAKAVKVWRSAVRAKPTKAQTDALVDLSYRVEQLWQIAWHRLRIAEQEARRAIPVWGADDLPSGGTVQREQIEAALADASGAYQRLRRVMDAWCALWFWPLTDASVTVDGVRVAPPTLPQWIEALQMLLGRHAGKRTMPGADQTLSAGTSWDELDMLEQLDRGFASASKVDAVLSKHPWLLVCERIAEEQGFFHWDLEFSTVFANRGFDLVVGNPPWVRPSASTVDLLAEFDVRVKLCGSWSPFAQERQRAEILGDAKAFHFFVETLADLHAGRAFVTSSHNYHELSGVQGDLYRSFMVRSWRAHSSTGICGLIHYETHFSEGGAEAFREIVYRRLRRHWGFVNQLKLFEIGNTRSYGVNIYGPERAPRFLNAAMLYHPDTVERSLTHDGSGPEPGIKDSDGGWGRSPHRARVIEVDLDVLEAWASLLDPGTAQAAGATMLFAVNAASYNVARKLDVPERVGALSLAYDNGISESTGKVTGLIAKRWGVPEDWGHVVLQGSQVEVANPFFQAPNRGMTSHRDFHEVDLEALSPNAVPVTAYKYSASQVRDFGGFRIAWRNMADNVGALRTLKAVILPPGAGHIHSITSAEASVLGVLPALAGFLASMVADFAIRLSPRSTISGDTISRLPLPRNPAVLQMLALRALRLNALSSVYEELWKASYDPSFQSDNWALPGVSNEQLGAVSETWSPSVPLRRARSRRGAQVEIDVLAALELGVTVEELCTIYRTQFAVLYGYDHNSYFYDANGRLVPTPVLQVWRRKGDVTTREERTAVHPGSGIAYTYELPFATLDREADMRTAYADFERRLAERS